MEGSCLHSGTTSGGALNLMFHVGSRACQCSLAVRAIKAHSLPPWWMSLTLVGWLCDVHHSLMPDMSGHWPFYVDPWNAGLHMAAEARNLQRNADELMQGLCHGAGKGE